MTRDEYADFLSKAMKGTLPDEQNPIFIFSSKHTDLLLKIVSGELDAKAIAIRELYNRGLNEKGKQIKFK